MNKSKKIISILAAAMLAVPTLALSACSNKDYKGEELDGYVSDAKVSSNGGFAVEKGDYVYFINGVAANTDDNTYGDVVKGALMRISKDDLAKGKGDEAKVVVPSLFVAGDYTSGIYIFGDYVYYATPTTDKNKDGQIDNSSLDFKRAKLDGSEAPMGGDNQKYFFRLSTNSAKYRFVEEGDTVYCLYVDNSVLKSYNTETGTTTTLVSGAGSYFFDTNDLTNPNVYYTMSLTYNPDSDQSLSGLKYNQIYSVNAAASAKVDADAAKYTVYDKDGKEGRTYDFDEEYLKAQNKTAKENKEDEPYDLKDYTTYPYVNLGQLVLDGIGKTAVDPDMDYHDEANFVEKADTLNLKGYTYTLQSYVNGGIYYTRDDNTEQKIDNLYYLADERKDWNTVSGNSLADVVSDDTSTATSSALYQINEGKHTYFYLSDTQLIKKTEAEEIVLSYNVTSGSTLWKLDGDYLYFYSAGTNGNNLSRIYYKGEQKDYKWEAKYEVETLSVLDWSDSWYKPELFEVDGETIVLYPNAQTFGSAVSSFNYIYAANLSDVETQNEEMEKVADVIAKGSTEAQAVMQYYYRTGSLDAYEDVKDDLYKKNVRDEIDEFVALFGDDASADEKLVFESKYVQLVGKISEDDEEAIAEGWVNSLLTATEEEEEEEGLDTWAIVLIVCGSVLVAAGAVAIPTIIVMKKKKAEKRRNEAIVSAYKRKKLDTTDDKSIDVYADEEEAPVEEEAAAPEAEAPATEEASAPVEE